MLKNLLPRYLNKTQHSEPWRKVMLSSDSRMLQKDHSSTNNGNQFETLWWFQFDKTNGISLDIPHKAVTLSINQFSKVVLQREFFAMTQRFLGNIIRHL